MQQPKGVYYYTPFGCCLHVIFKDFKKLNDKKNMAKLDIS